MFPGASGGARESGSGYRSVFRVPFGVQREVVLKLSEQASVENHDFGGSGPQDAAWGSVERAQAFREFCREGSFDEGLGLGALEALLLLNRMHEFEGLKL